MSGDKRAGSNSFDGPLFPHLNVFEHRSSYYITTELPTHSSASQPLLEEKAERYTDGPHAPDNEDDYPADTQRQTAFKKRRRLILIAASAAAVALLAGFLTLVFGTATIAGHAACTMERMGLLSLPDHIKETSSVPNPFAASTRCGMLDLHKRRQKGEDLRQIWRNVPFEGGMQATYLQNVPPEDLQSQNITEVKAVLRAVVVDTGDPTVGVPASSDLLQVRFFMAIWDFPLKDTNHARWTSLEKHLRFNITLTDPTTGQVHPGQQTRKAYADLQTHFPAHLFAKNANTTASSRPAPVYQIALRVMYGEQSAATFDFLLHQTWTPYTKFATCLKPMYSPKEPSHSVEWRAHHKAMGFNSVHWASRNASAAADVARMNERMGLTDTFEWIPMLGSSLRRTPFFDEELLFPECYAMYRRTAEWIAVHDTDEYLGFRDQLPWTSEFTATWFDNLPKTVKTIKAPFAWVDNNRFQHIPHEEYLAVDPTITEEEMEALDKLALTSQGLRPMTETYGMLLKSIHRTNGIDVALVHLGFWGQSAAQEPEIDLYAYHVRGGQGEKKDLYRPFHVTPSTLAFWRKQAKYVAMVEGTEK